MSIQFKGSAFVIAFTAFTAFTGCISDAEREARQEWAFDLSGEYTEDRAVADTLVIENDENKNDVTLTITRIDLDENEAALLERVSDQSAREALQTTLVLGANNNPLGDSLRGGENISKDFGATSEILVSSDYFDAEPLEEGATNARLRYTAKLTIENGSDRLVGALKIESSETREEDGDEGEESTRTHVENEEFEITFLRLEGPIESQRCENDCLPTSEDENLDAGE